MKLITEEVSKVKFIVEGKGDKKKMFIEGVFLQGEIKNRNGRMYPISTLAKEVGRYNQSLFVAIDSPTVFKESVASCQTTSVTNASAAIKFGLPSGTEAPFVVGDTVQVTGCAPSGINTTSASVTAVTGPDPINGVQSGTVTLGYGDANLSATDGVGEIRKVVKVAVRATGKTHISEVQIVGDF